jgi:hypothetical protein
VPKRTKPDVKKRGPGLCISAIGIGLTGAEATGGTALTRLCIPTRWLRSVSTKRHAISAWYRQQSLFSGMSLIAETTLSTSPGSKRTRLSPSWIVILGHTDGNASIGAAI